MNQRSSVNERIASYLNGRKLKEPLSKNYSRLSSKDQQIVSDRMRCLTNYEDDCTVYWKVLVDKIKERIHRTLINEFALNFQAQVSEMVNESGLISFSQQEHRLKQILQQIFNLINKTENASSEIDALFEQSAETDLQALKDDIRELFQKKMVLWSRYLDLSGRGIIQYLSEITEFDFNPPPNDWHFSAT